MKYLALVLLSFLLLSRTSYSQERDYSGKDLVIVRMVLCNVCMGNESKIHITKEDGSYEIIPVERFKTDYLKESDPNQMILHKKLDEYCDNGYEITSHSYNGWGGGGIMESYVLVRNKTE